MEKVATENSPSATPGNTFNIDKCGIQINNKPDSVVKENGSEYVHVVKAGEKNENIRVVACCNAAGRFLPPVLITWYFNKEQNFGDCGQMCTQTANHRTLAPTYSSEDIFKHKASGKVIHPTLR